jgi:BatD DUF11 like domain
MEGLRKTGDQVPQVRLPEDFGKRIILTGGWKREIGMLFLLDKLQQMKNIISQLFCLLFVCTVAAQNKPSFEVTVSYDSVLIGNQIEVEFILKQAKARRFEPPTFEGFDIVSGPNHSSSIQIVNGDMKQSTSYVYVIEPKEVGTYSIGPCIIGTETDDLQTLPVEIRVFPNPEGIRQAPKNKRNGFSFDGWGEMPKRNLPKEAPTLKKERKTIRI